MPKEKTKEPLLIRLLPETKKKLQHMAQELGVSTNSLVSQIIWEYMSFQEETDVSEHSTTQIRDG